MTQVVCFKLISGNEIVGKFSEEKTHRDFIDGQDAIYLDDAVFIGISRMENGEAGIGLGPVSGIGDNPEEGKAKMPFALYKNAIMGQVPLSPEINKMYREATSGIALIR